MGVSEASGVQGSGKETPPLSRPGPLPFSFPFLALENVREENTLKVA